MLLSFNCTFVKMPLGIEITRSMKQKKKQTPNRYLYPGPSKSLMLNSTNSNIWVDFVYNI